MACQPSCRCRKCTLPTSSQVKGTDVYYTGSYLPTLQVGVNTTFNEFAAKVDQYLYNLSLIAGGSTSKLDVTISTISNTYQNNALIGKTILVIIRNNQPEQDYTFTSLSGTLNFSTTGGLYPDDKLTIIYT